MGSPCKTTTASSTCRNYFQRPRYVIPPGKFTHTPPRELKVTGPTFVDTDAPEPEMFSHEFLPSFFLSRYSKPITTES